MGIIWFEGDSYTENQKRPYSQKVRAPRTGDDDMIILQEKLNSLKSALTEMGSALVAFSGGADSTFLLKIASDVLKNRVIAVTASSETYPRKEIGEAQKNAKGLGVKHIIIYTNELGDPEFVANTPERCYYCKKQLFSKLLEMAKQRGLNHVIDAANHDDASDFRPGMRAGSELGVKSPLKDAEFTKEEIRALSKKMNLPTWDKPSSPCLATRFPYGVKITKERLSKVEQAEDFLTKLGIRQLRVRDHGEIARIEVLEEDIQMLFREDVSKQIKERLKSLGYIYVCLDLEGYRMGSMDEPLQKKG
jgi:uncharacterized protein